MGEIQENWVTPLKWLQKESEVTQSCPPLCDPMDCSLPGSSVHGILQARILEWVALPFSREPSQASIKHRFRTLQADSLPAELPGKWPQPPPQISVSDKDKRKVLGAGQSQLWEVIRKSRVNKSKVVTEIYGHIFSIDKSLLWFRIILLFLVQRGRYFQMENSFINVNVCLLKSDFYSGLQSFSCVFRFLKIVNSKEFLC